ncbi:MAG: glucokinase, partial [Halioglobus sp.]
EEAAPTEGCIAVAAAPSEDHVTMFNIDWSFSCSQLAQRFNFARFGWINDFTAIAYALPFLEEDDRHVLYPGQTSISAKYTAVGPGTGLGGASIEQLGDELHVSAAEPGHMSLSPDSQFELELFQLLSAQHDYIYAELLVSGPGLQRLYQAICTLNGLTPEALEPAEISVRAIQGDDKNARQALELFCALLGSVCGDFVLANGAYGGLYLAGGIVPGLLPFLESSDFHQRFCHKGAMKAHMAEVPVFVITTGQPGLIGAAHAPF